WEVRSREVMQQAREKFLLADRRTRRRRLLFAQRLLYERCILRSDVCSFFSPSVGFFGAVFSTGGVFDGVGVFWQYWFWKFS
ncbi:MAG: hypothetical protein H7835_20665, partial [Magnetococcus sp. XQGC-1]